MVLLRHLEQSLRPVSCYYNSLTCINDPSNLLYGSPSTSSSLFYRAISTRHKPKAVSKDVAAKRHSEAERRRRLRINSHYETLRTILPNITKTDKATVLKEVLRRLNELKRNVKDLELVSPSEENSLKLSYSNRNDGDRGLAKVVFSGQERPQLLSEVVAALRSAKVKVLRAEIVTLSERTKCVLQIQGLSGKEGLERLRKTLKPIVNNRSMINMTR